MYVAGNNVIYTITARCNPGGATGNLYLQQGSLVDTLPAGLTFVSATPAPTSVAGGTVTWNYPTAGSLPSGCCGRRVRVHDVHADRAPERCHSEQHAADERGDVHRHADRHVDAAVDDGHAIDHRDHDLPG